MENAAEVLTVAKTCSRTAFADLVDAVLAARPEYAPQVTSGVVTRDEWIAAKSPQWRRLLTTPEGLAVGHVGVKADRHSPDLELCRLMVHPDWQRQGLASRLVAMAEREFGNRLFALVGPESPSHCALRAMGWGETGTAIEPGEPGTCVVMSCETPRSRPAR